ncbi:MAG: helix-turn-helix transcriptional regulator [Proteobacteria bacterium]|nr:helix-turn-helix transcriptional regulator [Pseudomonadota bacterium]
MAMNLTVLAYVITPLLDEIGASTAWLLCDAISVIAPALFWLFALVWFDDCPRLPRRAVQLVGLFALIPAVQLALVATTGSVNLALWAVAKAAMFGFSLAGVWIAWRGRQADLVEPRRRLRLWLAGTIGVSAAWVTGLEMTNHAAARSDPAHRLTLLLIFLATLAASAAMYQFRPADLFGAAGSPQPGTRPGPLPDQPLSPLAQRLLTLIGHERIYRTDGLSIAALAARLGEPEYRLRRIINGELGHRNFNAFLNAFRLAEARAALADPAQREVPILTIALDAGFGSIGPFNRAFRDAEGVTPSEYRAARLADSGIG